MKFHHIGIATENIEDGIEYLKKIFNIKDVSKIVYDANQNANLCMVTIGDGTNIELISGDVVASIVKKRQYLYHICYEVEDIKKEIDNLIDLGSFLLSEPKEAVLFENRKVAFLMTNMGLIELVEGVD